jgi:pimeloyl-ACP methyl ester carboxylesterase
MRRYGRVFGFVSEEGQAAYSAAYDACLALAPVAYETLDVATPFGATRVLAAGPADAPALVVLHGKSCSATMWLELLPTFTATHRTYLVDGIGELSRTVATRMMRGSDDVVTWLDAVLGALGVDRAAFVGLSNGGFQAATYATARPERVERVALLAPAAVFTGIKLAWWRSAVPIMFGTDRAKIERFWRTHSVSKEEPTPLHLAFDEQFLTGIVATRAAFRDAFPRKYKAERLRKMTMPVLAMVGEQEVIYDAQRFAAAVRHVLPHARVEVLADCGHAINFDQPKVAAELLGEFLAAGATDAAAG